MAGDSSFDPLALVKAMGAQTDPYSWAKDYSKSVDQKDALMRELANKMDIAEMGRDAQVEAAQIRASTAGRGQEGAIRLRDSLARGRDQERFDRLHGVSDQAARQSAHLQGFHPVNTALVQEMLRGSDQTYRQAIATGRLKQLSKEVWIIDRPDKPYVFNIPSNLGAPAAPREERSDPTVDPRGDINEDPNAYN